MSPFCWASWSCCRCIAAIERWRTTSAWSARNLFTAGLAPLKIAMPSVLNAIRADRDQIEEAVAEAEKQQVEQKAREDREKDGEVDGNKFRLDLEVKQAEANTEKTRAETAVGCFY